MPRTNFLLVGVGGQGTILASDVLSQVGVMAGYDAKKAEVHGMAQRGGSVTSHVRWAEKVRSPLTAKGEVDILVAFEKLEAVRYAEYLRPGGVVLANDHCIVPITVTSGDVEYPDDSRLRAVLAQVTQKVHWVDGVSIAEELGNTRVANIVLLGALSTQLTVPESTWLEVIEKRVPAHHVEVNRIAFHRGQQAIKG